MSRYIVITLIILLALASFSCEKTVFEKMVYLSEKMAELDEEEAFEYAKNKNTIMAFSIFVRINPESRFIDDASKAINDNIHKKYPDEKYEISISKDNLKNELLSAIIENKPLIIAFAPKHVGGKGNWEWTTHFIEIAGMGVKIDRMRPYINTPSGNVYYDDDNRLGGDIDLPPFGEAADSWWIGGDVSEMAGSSARLKYSGTYGDQYPWYGIQKSFSLNSYTKLVKKD